MDSYTDKGIFIPVKTGDYSGSGIGVGLDDCWKRTSAEIENIRKRLTRDFERQRALDRDAVLRSFLPVADNLERAMKAGRGVKNAWYEGLKAIHRQMVEALKEHNVTAFDPKGDRFDPALHEAAAVVSSPARRPSAGVLVDEGAAEDEGFDETAADGVVADVLLTGYTIGEGERRRVLRPAKVTVLRTRG
jgi:molecular chaperone GrpE